MGPPTYQHGAQPFNMREMDHALPAAASSPYVAADRQPGSGPADFFPQSTAPYTLPPQHGHNVPPPYSAVPFDQHRDSPAARQHGYPPQFVMPGAQIHGPMQPPSLHPQMYYPLPTANITHPYGVSPGAVGHAGSLYPQASYHAALSPAVGRMGYGHNTQASPQSSSSALASPRGPPRKPKQSGHALWVGNLPPAAGICDLKDHFAREATKDIESLFLIAKSNCAFVNYRSEHACVAAMHRFHDSRFNGVRLVCRLRKGSTTTTAAQSPVTGSSPDGRPVPDTPSVERSSTPTIVCTPTKQTADQETRVDASEPILPRVPEKFFILKSLTLQDLEASVRTGEWTTQLHNEAALNEAFDSADHVYLIFSANKSGEYFGYARMASPISGDLSATPAPTIHRQILPDDGPRSIPTAATETAPAGRIIDDSARGTIFWEADEQVMSSEEAGLATQRTTEDTISSEQDLGRPFKIEWICTTRLPFFRTRGLRNPWNANREVKIARDGTELEPGVGKRLVPLFHIGIV